MIFGLTHQKSQETYNRYILQLSQGVRRFAWFPVTLADGRKAWLQHVYLWLKEAKSFHVSERGTRITSAIFEYYPTREAIPKALFDPVNSKVPTHENDRACGQSSADLPEPAQNHSEVVAHMREVHQHADAWSEVFRTLQDVCPGWLEGGQGTTTEKAVGTIRALAAMRSTPKVKPTETKPYTPRDVCIARGTPNPSIAQVQAMGLTLQSEGHPRTRSSDNRGYVYHLNDQDLKGL